MVAVTPRRASTSRMTAECLEKSWMYPSFFSEMMTWGEKPRIWFFCSPSSPPRTESTTTMVVVPRKTEKMEVVE